MVAWLRGKRKSFLFILRVGERMIKSRGSEVLIAVSEGAAVCSERMLFL